MVRAPGKRVLLCLSRQAVLRLLVLDLTGSPALVPMLLLAPSPLALGVIFGLMFVPFPLWNAVGGYQMLAVPDETQARIQGIRALLSAGALPLAALAVGLSLESVGSTATVLWLFALMVPVAVIAALSRAVRTNSHRSTTALSA